MRPGLQAAFGGKCSYYYESSGAQRERSTQRCQRQQDQLTTDTHQFATIRTEACDIFILVGRPRTMA